MLSISTIKEYDYTKCLLPGLTNRNHHDHNRNEAS